MSNEPTNNENSARPRLVWALTSFYMLPAVFILWAAVMVILLFNGGQLNEFQQESIAESSCLISYVLAVSLLNILGATWLFLLKRHAFHCFLVLLIINILGTASCLMSGCSLSIFVVFYLVISIVVVLYSKDLIKKGTLT